MVVLVSRCRRGITSLASRVNQMENFVASDIHLQRYVYNASLLNVLACQSKSSSNDKGVHLCIEDDGFVWKASSLISWNSTPLNPLDLK